ncbi:arginine decarboxylase, pyruvoyl-dependent [candidate division NPL-UPA2 bacterium Unc8]|uniref:Pyruvoyl-dependent arginine decarboxylase AaxB n=1 Tax=candidate division NPL-UPA2 bacterium Unc8 TaxID=1980939 RepID=A0A399FY63_UNCN2|nr:MAG: arginine decarboxylase, pyruvoyl-dependent [candidate division NPL-UPA2 bacterium Unc8]
MIPQKLFLTKGVGKHQERLQSFEAALRTAGIAAHNLVRVSSILPPGCRIISQEKGKKLLSPGQIIYAVISEQSTNEPHRLLAASIGVAVPTEKAQHGYLSEYHSFGQTARAVGDYAEDLAATMLASTLGIPFDIDKAWDERKQIYKMYNQIVRTTNITQSAVGNSKGLWTTVIAAAVFIPPS